MGISPFYVVLLMLVGVLIFGKDLPGMMRKLGTALMEFRKGMSEISSEAIKNKSDSKLRSVSRKVDDFEIPVCDSNEDTTFSDSKFEPPI
ncbi:MAG: twin-arginine translocase TatA/TatE family subunit [Planctomycetaceae bacterium]|jgi:TatA/E family protein of Tat protein translocase|nr:twin-arginine translocase TatA/TatE family subunit [Planctomycetaceae bacterium]